MKTATTTLRCLRVRRHARLPRRNTPSSHETPHNCDNMEYRERENSRWCAVCSSREETRRQNDLSVLHQLLCCPDSRELAKTQGACKRLEQEVLELRRDLETCQKEAKQSAEEANMAIFQNQLLIDMVRMPQQLLCRSFRTNYSQPCVWKRKCKRKPWCFLVT